MATLNINNKKLTLPAFFPDATHGTVRGVGSKELINENVEGIVVNTYHFLASDKIDSVEKVGGIHKFTNFPGIIITDSGGFQALSLIRRNPKNGKISNDGVTFVNPETGKKVLLTPEICIETQARLGSDIIMCLDDCTDPGEILSEQEISVKRTIEWAKRCRNYFDKRFRHKKTKSLLFGIIQGGESKSLRSRCASGLMKIGFDGYAFGGWPMSTEKKFLSDILKYTASLMPDDKPKYAMGVGKPDNIKKCSLMGYNIFDCVLPTRDARHERLYVKSGKSYKYMYIGSSKYKTDNSPISKKCNCHTCKNYSKAYLYNAFKNNDPIGPHLATLHNIRFYTDYMKSIIS